MYPNPGFPIYESVINYSGAKPIPIPLREENNFSFDADEVLSLISPNTSLIIINTPANPTGGAISRSEIVKLIAGLEKHPHVAILSDEIYSRAMHAKKRHVSQIFLIWNKRSCSCGDVGSPNTSLRENNTL